MSGSAALIGVMLQEALSDGISHSTKSALVAMTELPAPSRLELELSDTKNSYS